MSTPTEADLANAPSTASAPVDVAAVDLGSNSFHMVIGRAERGEVAILDRLREPVRLAAGLDPDDRLDDATVDRALDCLKRFAERLEDIPNVNIRAVGTNTLRRAKPSSHFLSRARRVLGVPIEILPGPEEARLIYLGVAHDLAVGDGRRLVVDIGGGSTECVLGEGMDPTLADSFEMGCVRASRTWFPGGELSRDRFKRAETAARLELESVQRVYRQHGWSECIGASGTIKAIAEILRAQDDGDAGAGVTLAGLRRVRRQMIASGDVRELRLPTLTEDRRPVLAGGLAILKAVFQGLKIERMTASASALREGLLYDLLGRIAREDPRERTVRNLVQRWHVDVEQAGRVERTVAALVDGGEGLAFDDGARRVLAWAARLHEIGLAISYSGYHKHGEYLLTNSNMPGFSREDHRLLATLVRAHRRKIDRALFEQLPPFHRDLSFQLALVLRLAIRLNRGRSRDVLPPMRLAIDRDDVALHFPAGWLDERPLTRADLEEEATQLAAVGLRFEAS